MDYVVNNCAPESDVISISVGGNDDSRISITISREESGEVHVTFVDKDYCRNMVLGKESNPIQFGSVTVTK